MHSAMSALWWGIRFFSLLLLSSNVCTSLSIYYFLTKQVVASECVAPDGSLYRRERRAKQTHSCYRVDAPRQCVRPHPSHRLQKEDPLQAAHEIRQGYRLRDELATPRQTARIVSIHPLFAADGYSFPTLVCNDIISDIWTWRHKTFWWTKIGSLR